MLVLGLDNSGKTTIINHLMGRDTSKVSPTMGFQIHTFLWKGYNINAWDVGGQTTLRAFWSNYFDKSDVIVWVIDGTSVQRLNELYRELREKVIKQDQLVGTYFAVVINKMDLLSGEERQKVQQDVISGLNLLLELNPDRYRVQLASGITGDGLTEVVDWIILKEIA